MSNKIKQLNHILKVVLILLAVHIAAMGQSPMQPGFTMLEKGDFAEARVFFEEYLKTEPDNKTAQLCHARALGLSASAADASDIFSDMLIEYPGDLEILLNYAESYLWQKNYDRAEKEYKAILIDHPESFPALLGYANTNSNLKRYERALEYINKALVVSPGNASAETSKKFILLGLASQQTKNGEYTEAKASLDTVLSLFPDDKGALLNKAINYILWDRHAQAREIYEHVLTAPIDTMEGYLGLSYVNLLMNKPKVSYNYALRANEYIDTHGGVEHPLYLKTKINLINSYGVIGQFRKSFALLDEVEATHATERDVRLARARMNLWSRNKSAAKELYDEILAEYPDTYDVMMGYVDVMRVYRQDSMAQYYLDQSLEQIPGQPDVVRLKANVHRNNTVSGDINYFRGEDNGGNLSDNLSAQFNFNSYKKLDPYLSFKNRISYTEANPNQKLSLPRLQAGAKYVINADTELDGAIGVAINNTSEGGSNSNLNTMLALKRTVAKHHNFTFKYFTDFQDFTAGLVDEQLSSHNFEMDYFVSSFTGPGFYSQFIYTTQNDDNTRFLMFLSPYMDFQKVPNIKAGINFLYMTYAVSRPLVYFSPDRFISLEAFASTENAGNRKAKLLYRGFAAVGMQKIEEQGTQSTLRVEGELGYRFSHDLEFRLFGSYSNAAQSTATGFSYQTLGAKLKFYLR